MNITTQQATRLLEAAEALAKAGNLVHGSTTNVPNGVKCEMTPEAEWNCGACTLKAAIEEIKLTQ